MKIINLSKNTVLAENAVLADNPLSRTKGLLGRKAFLPHEALVLAPCNSIHTFFMRFSIDVIFVDRVFKVVSVIPGLKPFRLSKIYFSASRAIELPTGVIVSTRTSPGDILRIE
ncbi:MAG: DUF192 domain-containing protein [Candidatus Omnitrophica bacterium]|nr:DUF192 domain-containing protein [Candidatus Omnitrophota bacterium]